jgi:hypothetical protein
MAGRPGGVKIFGKFLEKLTIILPWGWYHPYPPPALGEIVFKITLPGCHTPPPMSTYFQLIPQIYFPADTLLMLVLFFPNTLPINEWCD